MRDNILEVKNLKVRFDTPHGTVKAVDGVSFEVKRGETFGIVGESGSGKTLTALSLLKLIPKPGRILEGEAIFNGVDLLKASSETLRSVRGSKISMVFQEPATSLDPVFTIGEQLTEALAAHRILKGGMADRDICMEHLAKVHIADPKKVYYDYPHQLSGGTKQRVMIAMALLNSPELLILDEPTTALDVTIQAQILDTLIEIEKREGLSTLFISHDLGIIAKMCRRIAVMRKGRIVETGDRDEIFFKPGNPYTISLLESVKALL